VQQQMQQDYYGMLARAGMLAAIGTPATEVSSNFAKLEASEMLSFFEKIKLKMKN
jgi:hypothetical protein